MKAVENKTQEEIKQRHANMVLLAAAALPSCMAESKDTTLVVETAVLLAWSVLREIEDTEIVR